MTMLHQPISKDSLRATSREEVAVFRCRRFRVVTWIDTVLARRFTRLQSRFVCAILTFFIWAQVATAFAQGRGQPAPAASAEKSYILPYVIVVLCIALGLLVVCRSGGRSNEPKVEDLEK